MVPFNKHCYLSYHWLKADSAPQSVILWEGERSPLARDLPPANPDTTLVQFTTPETPGSYLLQFNLVREGDFSLSQKYPQLDSPLFEVHVTHGV
jgi:hypothetical protein